MPAVDPERLKDQIAQVVAVFDDPTRFRFRCLELLEFYSSRIRPTAVGSTAPSVRTLGVPHAVLRDLQSALQNASADAPHAAAMNAEGLWTAVELEARLLAISILEIQAPQDLAEWVGAWAESAGDVLLLERLAKGPLRSLHEADALAFWSAIRGYQESRSAPRLTLAFISVGDLALDLPDDELSEVFDLLAETRIPMTGEAGRALAQMTRRVASRTPGEAAQFLIDAMRQARPNAVRLTRLTLDAFPAVQRQALRHELRLTASA